MVSKVCGLRNGGLNTVNVSSLDLFKLTLGSALATTTVSFLHRTSADCAGATLQGPKRVSSDSKKPIVVQPRP